MKEKLIVWVIIFSAYASIDAFTVWPKQMTLTNGDEPHYLVTANSIVRDHDFDVLNNYDRRQYQSWYDAPLDPHLMTIGGRQYSLHGVGLPLLLAPGFALWGRNGAVATVMAIMALGIVQLYLLCLDIVSRRAAIVTTAIAALSLPLVAYSRALYPDSIGFAAVTFAVGVLWEMWDERRLGRIAALLVILSLLPWLHPRFGLLSVGFGLCAVWVAWRTNSIRRCAPLALIPLAGLLGYGYAIHSLYRVSLAQYLDARSFGGSLFGLSHLGGLVGIFLDRTFGLIWYAPLYLFGFSGLITLVREPGCRKRLAPVGIVCLAYLVMIATFFEWHGGFAPTPRYLVPIMAPLVIGLARSYDGVLQMGRAWRFQALLVPTALIALIGSFYPLTLLPVADRNSFALAANAIMPDFVYSQDAATYACAAAWLGAMVLFVNWPERRRLASGARRHRATWTAGWDIRSNGDDAPPPDPRRLSAASYRASKVRGR